jgi:hypothetical protein
MIKQPPDDLPNDVKTTLVEALPTNEFNASMPCSFLNYRYVDFDKLAATVHEKLLAPLLDRIASLEAQLAEREAQDDWVHHEGYSHDR